MNWKVRHSDLQSQFRKIESQMIGTIHRVLSRGDLLEGDQRRAFEQAFASTTGTAQASALRSCTDAFAAALQACGVSEGDDVIATVGGFSGTMTAIKDCGARPVLVDVDTDNLMDPQQVAAAVNEQTKAIIPVHLNGHCADMPALCQVASVSGCSVIEDATSALGARIGDRPVGSFGTAAVFDVGITSMLSGIGDGGVVVTKDDAVGEQLEVLSSEHTLDRSSDLRCLNNLLAAVLELKLKHLPDDIRRRRELAEIYQRGLRRVHGLSMARVGEKDRFEVYHRFEIQSPYRNDLSEFLNSRGIQHELPQPLSRMALNSGGQDKDARPLSQQRQKTALFLPLHPEMTSENVEFVAQSVDQFHRTRKEHNRAA